MNAEFDTAGGSIKVKDFIDCGEGKDSSTLELPFAQNELLKELRKLGKPIVTILIQGRPYIINNVIDCSDAILNAWYPGQEGGFALADIVSGKVNPSGKLTVSIPKNVGCIPVNYNRVTKFDSEYVDTKEKVSYPFGYGLSYSEFSYNNFEIKTVDKNCFEVFVDVTNNSNITGKETVMLFIHGKSGSVSRRQRELKGFKKIEIKPFETKRVSFVLDERSFMVWTADNKYAVETSEVDVLIGGNPNKLLCKTIKTIK